MSYSDLLRDPRWQRKRLEVMQRADFACEACGDKTSTLNVHHERYVAGRKPWEYDNADLHCLCENCHRNEHGIQTVLERKAADAAAQRRRDYPDEAALLDQKAELLARIGSAPDVEKGALIEELSALTAKIRAAAPPTWKHLR